MMKRISITILIVTALFTTLTAELLSDNGRAGNTGSPGELTCNTNQCHNSFTLNSGTGSVSATSTMNNWTYDPLTSYTITVKVAKASIHLFGFAAEILTSANANAGNLVVYDATRTQIKTATISGVSRRAMTHKLNGGASQDSMLFIFNWTSPDTTAGPVTLYYAGNASNADTHATGDYIYTGSQIITPSSGNKVNEISQVDPFTVTPNPASTNFGIHFTMLKNENVLVKLYSMNGSLSYELLSGEFPAGPTNETIQLPSQIAGGLYILSVESASNRICKKMIIN